MENKIKSFELQAQDQSETGLTSLDIEDIGEISWKDRIRPKPALKGKYLRGDFLGQGTFAKVFEVLDIISLERRAVKIFDLRKIDRKFNRDEILRMVNQEIALLRGCDHPNVIKLADVHRSRPYGESSPFDVPPGARKKNKIWMYLEYCMASVAELLEQANPPRLPRWQARRYFKGLINGLDYLHSRGIFHKDIKPANMLINVVDSIKITDLGVSHVIDIFSKDDTCYNTFGTVAYQSPEVISSDDTGYSAAALDVWSCGVTLYVMVTGILPFSGAEGYLKMTNSIMKDKFTDHCVLHEDNWMTDLIDKMLTKDPNQRITMAKIQRHFWFVTHLSHDTPFVKVPPRHTYGDQYRSLTITAYLHELHYPLPLEANVISVSESSADEFKAKRKIPILRSNRSPSRMVIRRRRLRSRHRPNVIQKLKTDNDRFFGIMGLSVNLKERRKHLSYHRNANVSHSPSFD